MARKYIYGPGTSDCQLPIFNFRLCRRWDAYTGLYYCRMRDYSPQLGRFLQPARRGRGNIRRFSGRV
ncbi:MAG TPA: hypothetical protein PKY88_12290 [Anaerohalosphaeraceae bacterium]|nr:hypothetical protein [Anaerohalosphaeraceae bacterium]